MENDSLGARTLFLSFPHFLGILSYFFTINISVTIALIISSSVYLWPPAKMDKHVSNIHKS